MTFTKLGYSRRCPEVRIGSGFRVSSGKLARSIALLSWKGDFQGIGHNGTPISKNLRIEPQVGKTSGRKSLTSGGTVVDVKS
jgi:hypothetical protein